MDVSWPGHSATVLVALAWTGSIPVPSMAGKDKNEPPPATALSTPARNAATISHAHDQVMKAGRCVICLYCMGLIGCGESCSERPRGVARSAFESDRLSVLTGKPLILRTAVSRPTEPRFRGTSGVDGG